MNKRFNDYTDAELLALDNETINDAIRIEAIQQGVQPPITLSEALRKSEWVGYQKPAESVAVFEIMIPGEYGTPKSTGVAYLTREKAEAALDGVISVWENTYGKDIGWKMKSGDAAVVQRFVGVSKAAQQWAKLEEFQQDQEPFQKVCDSCLERLSRVRQEDYDRRVNEEKRAEYLRLAGGNEEIARGFWGKVERTEWPVAA